ncbi:hypothetical protein, partial [Bittarella massiliensis (ex Durand et al. 2017)]
ISYLIFGYRPHLLRCHLVRVGGVLQVGNYACALDSICGLNGPSGGSLRALRSFLCLGLGSVGTTRSGIG